MTERHGLGVRNVAAIAGLGLAALLLGGCHSEGGDATARLIGRPAAKKVAPPAEPAVDPAVTQALRSMAAGVPIGTGTAPLEVRFDLASVPNPGEPFALGVAVLPDAPAPVLRLEITGSEGLTILDPEAAVSFEKVQAGSVTKLEVRASSASAGTRLVQVRATLELPDGPESRTFAFPVVIGATPAAPTPAPAPATKTATR